MRSPLFLFIALALGTFANQGRDTAPASSVVADWKRRARKHVPTDATNAKLIFDEVWAKLTQRFGGENNLRFPKEMIWLNGAPGAGKTTNTGFIRSERSITSEPLVVSSLLLTPEMEAIKANGFLVGDSKVTELLFMEFMKPQYQHGLIIDGYPRSLTQATIVRMLHDRLTELHRNHKNSAPGDAFSRPIFRIVVLYADELTSVDRQMSRAKKAEEHNRRVQETGVGAQIELRATDLNKDLAQRRYKTFIEQGYGALQSLRDLFIYNLINAGGTLEEVKQNIEREMEYQSSIELNPDTFDIISPLELASEVTMNARQRLVQRMDSYAQHDPETFKQVADALRTEIYPVIKMHAVSGRCSHVSHNTAFSTPHKLQMAIDIFTERGFRVSSEPVVRGVQFIIRWIAPDKLGMTRNSPRQHAASQDETVVAAMSVPRDRREL